MRSILHSPLTHVFVLGVLLALALLIVHGPPSGEDEARRVVITGSDLIQLRAAFARTWQREPTETELRGEIQKLIREEVLYREALARGYDRDDVVVRRAMQRKMEFLAEAQGLREPPTDEEIQAYFALRRERYSLPVVLSFAQVYFSQDSRGAKAEEDARAALVGLRRADPDPESLLDWGDRIMLDSVYRDQTEQQVRSAFGNDFADAVLALEPGDWQGPIRSGYGIHLVKVFERTEKRVPEWNEVRSRVLADMEFEASTAAREQLFQEIAQNYRVVFDSEVKRFLDTVDG